MGTIADGIKALEEDYDQLALPLVVGLLEWALGTIDELNNGPMTVSDADEDGMLYLQARDVVKRVRDAENS